MHSLRSITPLFLLVASAFPISAQQAAPPATQPVPSNQITLDVFAADKLGHSIRGLTQQDFIILDNGKPQPITSYRVIDTETAPDAVRVLLVIDEINVNINVVARLREQVGEYLNQDNGKLSRPTSLAIMTETGVQLAQGYTQDGHTLNDVLAKAETHIRPVGRDAGFYGAAERLNDSLRALNQIVLKEAAQPGRKLILVLGPGWPLLPEAGVQESDRQRAWVFDTIVRLTNTLRESHTALYSINPFIVGTTDPFFYQSYLKPVKKQNQAEYPNLALQVLAVHSGGRALVAGNDVVGSINSALHDAGTYYEMAFEPALADKPNEYHELRVQATHPDAILHTSASYYAQPQPFNGKTTPPDKIPEPSMAGPH